MATNIKYQCEFVPGPVHIHDSSGESAGPIKFGKKIVRFTVTDDQGKKFDRYVEAADWKVIKEYDSVLNILEMNIAVAVGGKLVRMYRCEKEYIKEML